MLPICLTDFDITICLLYQFGGMKLWREVEDSCPRMNPSLNICNASLWQTLRTRSAKVLNCRETAFDALQVSSVMISLVVPVFYSCFTYYLTVA